MTAISSSSCMLFMRMDEDPILHVIQAAAALHVIQGPREDSGFLSDVNPGVRMAARMYNYCQKYHPKTKVMVSGLRKAKGGAISVTPLASNSLCHMAGSMCGQANMIVLYGV